MTVQNMSLYKIWFTAILQNKTIFFYLLLYSRSYTVEFVRVFSLLLCTAVTLVFKLTNLSLASFAPFVMNTRTRCEKSLDQLCCTMVPELTTIYMLSRE